MKVLCGKRTSIKVEDSGKSEKSRRLTKATSKRRIT